MDITASSREQRPSDSSDTTVPGSMPQEPAVGAATILPIAALFSLTASALAIARLTNPPQMPPCEA